MDKKKLDQILKPFKDEEAALVATIPENIPAQLQELGTRANWQEKDGPYYGVWSDKPAGHRCIWSVKWITQWGEIIPEQYYAPALMSPRALILEALDITQRYGNPGLVNSGKHRHHDAALPVAAHLSTLLAGEVSSLEGWTGAARRYIESARIYYGDVIGAEAYLFPYAPPYAGQIMRMAIRPGWASADEIWRKAHAAPVPEHLQNYMR